MRNLILAALALSAVPSPDADACGGYESYAPRAHVVSGHSGRTFVLLGSATADQGVKWTRVASTTSFDHTAIAPAPALGHAVTLTLVGPGGSRVVSSRSQWLLRPAVRFRGVRSALEVQGGSRDFRVALVGDQTGARWIELAYPEKQGMASDAAWLKAQNLPATSFFVSTMPGYELITLNDQTTVVRKDGAFVTQATGSAMGGVTLNGTEYLVVQTDGAARLIEI
jgi:hypothetical protein